MKVSSPVFKNEGLIPVKYTCDGVDASPIIEWEKIDSATSYALIMEDPDAPGGTFVHWVFYNLHQTSLPQSVKNNEKSELGYQGINDFKRIGYGGPCPPTGHGYHRYYFNIYAVNNDIDFFPKMTATKLRNILKDKILDQGYLMGKYERS